MGAVENLKTLCCLGLHPESAMIALTPLLHEIIPHGWTRLYLVASDATITSAYEEHPEAAALYRERIWTFMDDPLSPVSLVFGPAFRAVGIGWGPPLQGRGYLEGAFYREIEAPLDACWWLDAMVGDGGRSIGFVHLTRPRSARPFTADDVQRLDLLRPWLAHAFRRPTSGDARQEDGAPIGTAGPTVLSGQMILTSDVKVALQTPSVEHLLRILTGEPGNQASRAITRATCPRATGCPRPY